MHQTVTESMHGVSQYTSVAVVVEVVVAGSPNRPGGASGATRPGTTPTSVALYL